MEEDGECSSMSSSMTVLGFEDLIERLKALEEKLRALETLQKQDADETVGMMHTLNETVEELEDNVEKLENQVEHHSHLFQRYRIADLFNV